MTRTSDGLTDGQLDWTHLTAAIPAQGLDMRRSATAEQRQAVAAALELLGLERLDVRYRITQAARGRFRLTGKLKARVVQACIITLEPVSADLAEPFDAEFWPADAMPDATAVAPPAGDRAVLEDDGPEPIEHNQIDAGRIVFEALATALDPYPRAPGAALEWPEPAVEDGAANGAPATGNPFAALAKLKSPGK